MGKYSLNAGVLVSFYDNQPTTVNRLRQELLPVPELTAAEIEQFREETLSNEKFVFSAYMSISSKILLLSDIILLVSEIGNGCAPASLTRLCEGIKGKVLSRKAVPKGEKALMAPSNDISFDRVMSSFGLYFDIARGLGVLRTFYGRLKSERTMSGFLNMELIGQFFKSAAAKGRENSERVLERFEELRLKAYEMQTRRFSQVFENFAQIFEELAAFKESQIEAGVYPRLSVSARKEGDFSSNFNVKSQKKQIEKIKAMNYASDEEGEKAELSMKGIETLEDLSHSKNYKASYFLGLEEGSPRKEDERSDSEDFEEGRRNVKEEISGVAKEVLGNDVKKSKAIPSSMKSLYQQDNYLRDMLRISAEKHNIERSSPLLIINEVYWAKWRKRLMELRSRCWSSSTN